LTSCRLRKKEFRDLQDIRERTSKRFWVKVKHPVHGKDVLSQKETKEEKEYMEAFAVEQNLKAEIEALDRQIEGLSTDVSGSTGHGRSALMLGSHRCRS
jgi:hypothetical protein